MNSKELRRKTLWQVLRYVKQDWVYLLLSLLLCSIAVAGTLSVPVLSGRAIDALTTIGKINFAMSGKLLPALLGICGVTLVAALAQWGVTRCNNHIAFRTVQKIRCDAFAHIQQLPLATLDKQPVGDVVSRVVADVEQFSDGLLLGFSQLFSGLLTILGTLVVMYALQPLIATVVVVVTPASLLVAALIAKRSYALFALQSQTRGEQTALMEEMVTHQKTVRAFAREEKVQEAFDDVNERLAKVSVKAIFLSATTQPSTRFVNGFVFTCVSIAGALLAIGSGGITIGQLTSFLSYANQYTKPFNEISGVLAELQNALVCARRVFDLMEEPAEEPDAQDALVLDSVDGTVAFRDVSFSYSPEKKLLENLTFCAKQGQRVAIVGPTGCGKTTLINLLMRFYEADEGTIEVSGHAIQRLRRGSLRRSFGMVLQDTWLKTGTVLENISMGREMATREEIIAAAQITHAHSFIKRLPLGYDTVLEEDSSALSQGERQLLCITRALLALPPMLILDEATASIDARTELEIQAAFDQLMQGRTSFVVAHRLSTIQNADQILVMNQGRIVETGTHWELLQKDGFYAKLYKSQYEI